MFKPKRIPALLQLLLSRTRQGSFVVSARRLVFVSAVLVSVLLLLPLFFSTRVYTRASHTGNATQTNATASTPVASVPSASVKAPSSLDRLLNLLTPQTASALASDNLNFQARLQTASGAIVPDGYYNIQFKLYSASSGGAALWTETYAYNSGSGSCTGPVGTNDCRVRVANGYVSVYLGSQTAFPGTMPWDQQLFLTMNVDTAGTTSSGAITYNGEMTPRLKLTAVPYAMRASTANQLQTTNGANIATLNIASPTTTGTQSFILPDQGTAGTYNILTALSGTDGYVKLQSAPPGTQQTGNLNISGAGIIGGVLQGGTLKAGSTQQFQVDASGNVTTSGSVSTGTGSLLTVGGATLNNSLAIGDVTAGGNIGTAAATVNIYTNFTIAQTTAGQTLTIPAPTTTTTGRLIYITNVGSAGYTIGGSIASPGTTMAFVWNSVTSAWTLISSGTTGAYIQNGTALQTANFNIQSYSTTSVTATIQGANSQSANILEVKAAGVGTPLFSVGPASISLGENTVLATGSAIRITGGNAASRPAGVEGMLYYDTTAHQLLVYNGTIWKASGSEAVLVAASNSSDSDKAVADYVADGNTGAANDGDQIQINQALAAADPAGSGRKSGKVYLFAGTYTIDNSISVPNNTTLAGAGVGTVITVPNSFNADIYAITNTTTGGSGTGIVIQDLKLDGNRVNQTSGTMQGVFFSGVGSGSGSTAVSGGKITNVSAVKWNSYGIYLLSSSNSSVLYSTILGNYEGLYSAGGSNNAIVSNTAQGNGDGLIINGSNNIVNDNTTQGNTTYGIYLLSGSNNTFTGNTAQGNGSGIFVNSGTSNTFTGNTAQGNTSAGIMVIGSNNTFTGNTALGNGSYGIDLAGGASNTVTGNTFADNGGANNNNGIFVWSDSNTITGNSITDSSASVTNYAINIFSGSSNYLANNSLGGGSVSNSGTTTYGGQLDSSNNYVIQPAGAINLNSDTVVATGKNFTVTSGTTALTGTVNINTSGAAVTSIGTGTGNSSIGNSTGTLGLTGSTVSVLGATSINTTGTATTTIGSNTAGAVSITSNAASNFSTNAGLLTLQGMGGVTVASTAGTTSSAITISTGNASAGAAGNISIDTGTFTSGTPTISIGTGNAAAVTIGKTTTTVTIQGNLTAGNAAGTGTFTNNGATKNISLALGDLAAGNIGTAVNTVDKYTSFTIAPTASGRTYTILAPTDGAAGRTIYISNISPTFTFTIGATLFNAHSTATLVYDGTSWNFAGMDGGSNNYIQNTTSVQSSSNFYISGIGKTDTAFTTPAIRAATDSTAAIKLQNAAGTTTALTVDTTNNRVGIGTATTPAATLHVGVNDSSATNTVALLEQQGSGNTTLQLKNSAESWNVGVDSSDSNSFKITTAATAAVTTTFGNSTYGDSSDTNDNNGLEAGKYTATATGNVVSLSINISCTISSAPNNQIRMAIYSDNGTGTSPSALLAQSVAGTLISGWNRISIPATAVTSGTVYWIVYNTNGTSINNNCYRFTSGVGANSVVWVDAYGFASLPSSWPGSTGNGTASPNFYATVQSSVATNTYTNSLFQMTNTGRLTLHNSLDSTSALQIQNASGASAFNVDTTNSRVGVALGTGEIAAFDLAFGGAANRTIGVNQNTTAGTGRTLTIQGGQGNAGIGGVLALVGGAGNGAGFAGGALTLTGGAGGTGNAAGGNISITGGTATGTGAASTVTIASGAAAGATIAGGALTINSGAGNTTGAGGLITIQSGAGGATGTGGALTMQAGNGGATSGAGGLLTLQGGNATAGASNGGGVSILAGASKTTGTAGAITITAGAGVAASNIAGGVINITAGAGGGTNVGGGLNLAAGQGGATGVGGDAIVTGGAGGATSGNGGNAKLVGGAAGTAAGSIGGGVTLQAANGSAATTGGAGGTVSITAGNALGTGANAGGDISLTAGTNSATGTGSAGNVKLFGGAASATNTIGGQVQINGGTGNGTQAGGAVLLTGGTGGTTGGGGAVQITGGTGGATSGVGGAASLVGGTAKGAFAGGTATLQGGTADTTAGSNGGGVTLLGATGTATGTGGAGGGVQITAGNAQGSGVNLGGAISLTAGNSTTTAAGGALTLLSGNSATGTAGTIRIDTGTGTTAGSINIGDVNAGSVNIGKTTTTVTIKGSLTSGNAAGTGTFTNNGATINTEKTYGNFATGGAIDTAPNSVDKYTYFSIGQTTTLQTITLPTPTTNPTTVFGRIIHVSNIGTASFTIGGSLIMPGYAATFIWSNTDGVATGGESWQYTGDGGGSGSYIQNQTATTQTANFNIGGSGTLGGTTNQTQLIVKANASQTATNPLMLLQSNAGAELARITADASGNFLSGYQAGGATFTGTYNTAVGYQSMLALSSGSYNSALGYQALSALNSGTDNTAVGTSAGGSVTSGGYNVFVGSNAGVKITSGSGNSFIGDNSGSTDNGGMFATLANIQQATAIGTRAQVTQNNSIVLGSADLWTNIGIGITSPQNLFSVSFTDYNNTTKATQSGTTVTAATAVFWPAMVGETLVWADDGTTATIISVGGSPSTTATVSTSVTKATATNFRTHYPGLQVNYYGQVGIGTVSPGYLLDVAGVANATTLYQNGTAINGQFIQNQTGSAQGAGFNISGAGTVGGLLTATAGATVSGAAINLNATSNFAVNIGTGTTNAAVSIGNSANTTNLASRTINIGTVGGINTIQGVTQTTNNTDGDQLTVKASAGLGSGNGGTILLSGGNAGATGVKGLVTLSTTAFDSSATVSFGSSNTLNSFLANAVNNYSSIRASATTTNLTLTIDSPSIQTVGRVLYLSNSGANDFTILLSGTSISINLKANSTATLLWNGNGWTAAGASSATDLQAAYNNTQTGAGGAEIVLKSTADTPAGTGGLTIRDNPSLSISGALLEVQSAIGTNMFAVNNNTTEYAVNGGAENSTFTGWAQGKVTTPTKNTTAPYYATGTASVAATVTATTQSIKNTLSTTLPFNNSARAPYNGQYMVSFTARSTSAFNLDVYYSQDGAFASVTSQCVSTLTAGYTSVNNWTLVGNTYPYWTKITCIVTVPASGQTAANAIYIRDTNLASGTFYVDNLSVTSNAATNTPANVQIGGGLYGGQPTLLTLDSFSAAPMTNLDSTYIGSMYYDTTTGSIQCYQTSNTWGSCGSAPDNIITLTPEYTNAVLNGTGVGTMTADFCANQPAVLVVGTLCATGEARNFYKWSSPQASPQSYSIYVAYKLPSTFKNFYNGTTSLTGFVDNTTNASVNYSIYRKASGGTVTSCSASKTVVGWNGVSAVGSASTWTSAPPTTDPSNCTTFAAGDTAIFQITVTAQGGFSAYAENLTFRYTNK